MEKILVNLLTRLRQIALRDNLDPQRNFHLHQACLEIERVVASLQDPTEHQESLHVRLCDALLHMSQAGFLEVEETEPFCPPAAGETTPSPTKLTQEMLAWARQQSTEEEIVAGIRNIRETGGLELRDFLHQLEQPAGSNE